MLWLEAQVSDGELSSVGSLRGLRDGTRRFQIVRVRRRYEPGIASDGDGAYRISLLPESTQFAYQITAWNPNRQHQALTVSLRNGEHVQKVEAGAIRAAG